MPVIEEIDDDEIDNKHYSIDDFESHNPFSKDMPVDEDAPIQLRPTSAAGSARSARTAPASSSSSAPPSAGGPPVGTLPGAMFGGAPTETPNGRPIKINSAATIPEHMKQWSVIYPVYFDKSKSVKEGRRVPLEYAVANPLAVLISDACQSLGFEHALEITKTHPKDWANPGRVRVNLAKGSGKTQIYAQIAKYLKANPANRENAREKMYQQIAQFDSLQPLAVPRNMKLPKILPGVSPALSARKTIDDMMSMDGGQMAKMMGMG